MHALRWLHGPETPFPPPEQALEDPPGLLCAGGDLSPARLEQAYRNGIFPWFEAGSPILWWSPDPRMVMRPGWLHISRSLRRRLNRRDYQVTLNQAFDRVVAACAEPRADAGGTWITREMARAYGALHRAGLAHSIEVWMPDTSGELRLGGGMYGVGIGAAFFGESMFSRATDGSKIAMVHLALYMQHWRMPMLDCQLYNPHLRRMGARPMARAPFLEEVRMLAQRSGPDWHPQRLF